MPSVATGDEDVLGVVAGRYELLSVLASGGMGHVWRARHVALDRVVALKVLRQVDDRAVERMLAEARALAKLRHPAVVQVFDCGVGETGAPFVAMELLEGPTLATLLEEQHSFGAVRAVEMLLPVLAGLTAIHEASIVHRDLKPENIVVTTSAEGIMPKLIDFGIAHQGAELEPRLTHAGSFVGTPQYMAPEQTLGAVGDARTDIWGFTVVLYEAIAGARPYEGTTVAELFHSIAYDPPAFPAHVANMDGRLWSSLVRGMRKKPEERYPSCSAMQVELEAWLHRARQQRGSAGPVQPAPGTNAAVREAVALERPREPETPMDALIRRRASK